MEIPASLIPPLYPSELRSDTTLSVDEMIDATPVQESVTVEPEDTLEISMDDEETNMMNLTIKELRKMCTDKGVSASGKKADMIARLTK